MAISLDGLIRNATQGQKAGVSASTKADLASGAYDIANKNVGQVDATNVQLSPFGQVKSSYVDVQAAGRTLTTPSKISTVEDATKAVQTFTDAYNNATKIASSAILGNSKPSAVTASGETVNLAIVDLKTVVTSGNNAADLKKIGVSVNQDNTLSVDTKTLQTAVQSNPSQVLDTLARVGAQAVQVSQKQLLSTDNFSDSVSTLNTRAKNLGIKSTGSQKPSSTSTSASQRQTSLVNSNAANGIAAYKKMLAF